MHLADTGALCMDIGYQLGQVACEALRTIVINTTQRWCGNRFAKGLIRFGGTHYPLTDDLKMLVLKNLNEVETRYAGVVHSLKEPRRFWPVLRIAAWSPARRHCVSGLSAWRPGLPVWYGISGRPIPVVRTAN